MANHLLDVINKCIGTTTWVRMKSNGDELKVIPAEITTDGYMICHSIDTLDEDGEKKKIEVEHNIPLNRIEDISYAVVDDEEE